MRNPHSLSPADEEELLPLVDSEGKVIGSAMRSECHKDNALTHPVVHVHITNGSGDLLLQKRSMAKLIQPGKWDTAVGGHITYGEPIEEALRREAYEEQGVKGGEFVPLTSYLWQCARETEFIYVYKCRYDNPSPVQVNEIDEVRFWTFGEIERNIGKGIFTPNFEKEFSLIKDLL